MKLVLWSTLIIFLFLLQITFSLPPVISLQNNSIANKNSITDPNVINNVNSGTHANALSANFTPVVTDDTSRNGSSFDTAIDIQENTIINGFLSNVTSAIYYRYYTLYPYDYVNINYNSSNGFDYNHIYLYDQFNTFITSNIESTNQKSINITSSKSPLHDSIRFIGWYYIKINQSQTLNNTYYQISIMLSKGDGSSLWDSIQISNSSLSYIGTFQDMENAQSSSGRDSSFYSFYVNSSLPQIEVTTNVSEKWLYGPDYSFLSYFDSYSPVDWIPTQSGFYYLEIANPSLIGHVISISISLGTKTSSIGDSANQPLEIPRSTGLNDTLPTGFYPIRYLKLFLYIGENISLNIGDIAGRNYSISVYGPWGILWTEGITNLYNISLELENVENSGYYLIQVNGPSGPYEVTFHFKYMISEGSSWESSRAINLNTVFSDQHFLFTNQSYYYRINFPMGSSLNISIEGNGLKNVEILGKDREMIGYLNGRSNFLILTNINTTNFIYIQINPNLVQSNYILTVMKIQPDFGYTLNIDGTLITHNIITNLNESVDLVSINLMATNSSGTQTLLQSSTDENGYFSFVYTKNLQIDTLYLNVVLQGPALKLLNYQAGHFEALGQVYVIQIDLNKNLLPQIHLGQILVADWSYEISHIFTTIIRGWLWIKNLDMTHIGPPQINILYAANSPGTYYIPNDYMNNAQTKYIIYLKGSNTGDDDGWDDSVFLHEYGHHVEQTYAITNNPGGNHGYSSTISPDFAHGEGFPTFFASQVLNSPIYKDTNSAGYDGINLDTARRLSSNPSITNRLEDLYGAYGETSVFSLYYDLVEPSNNTAVDLSPFSDSVSLSDADLFNVFMNFRRENGLGVTTTDELYQGLIEMYPNLIDNISKAFYAHGNSFYEYPFVGNEVTNKIITNSDTQANFTWKLYDSNPKSYQILVDSQIVKTGAWNFTEEDIILNIHQFNLTDGEHEFVLKINDTLDNQRVYNYTITILSVGNQAFMRSIPIEPNYSYKSALSATSYFSYQSELSGLVNLSFLTPVSSAFNLSIYNQNLQLIYSNPDVSKIPNVYLNYTSPFPIFIIFNYISGSGAVKFELQDNMKGFSYANPIDLNNSDSVLNSGNNPSSKYFIRIHTSYYDRILNVDIGQNSIENITIYTENNAKLTELYLNNTVKNQTYVFPISTFISDVQPYTAFPSYILEIDSNISSLSGTVTLTNLTGPILRYSGSLFFTKPENTTLSISYISNDAFNYSIFLNDSLLSQGSITYSNPSTGYLQIPIDSLGIGLYVIDIQAIDHNGINSNYQFSFLIILKVNSTSTSSPSPNNNSLFILLFGLLVISIFTGLIAFILLRNNQAKGKSIFKYLQSFNRKKKPNNK